MLLKYYMLLTVRFEDYGHCSIVEILRIFKIQITYVSTVHVFV